MRLSRRQAKILRVRSFDRRCAGRGPCGCTRRSVALVDAARSPVVPGPLAVRPAAAALQGQTRVGLRDGRAERKIWSRAVGGAHGPREVAATTRQASIGSGRSYGQQYILNAFHAPRTLRIMAAVNFGRGLDHVAFRRVSSGFQMSKIKIARGVSERFQASCLMVSSNTQAWPGTHSRVVEPTRKPQPGGTISGRCTVQRVLVMPV